MHIRGVKLSNAQIMEWAQIFHGGHILNNTRSASNVVKYLLSVCGRSMQALLHALQKDIQDGEQDIVKMNAYQEIGQFNTTSLFIRLVLEPWKATSLVVECFFESFSTTEP